MYCTETREKSSTNELIVEIDPLILKIGFDGMFSEW